MNEENTGAQGQQPAPSASEAAPDAERSFPIVGIGASAGGLAAIEAFFSALPANRETGIAFVVVQHLAPDHKSMLNELVRRYTRMQVFEVVDGVRVAPDCVYIIPPNRDMALLNGALQLIEPVSPYGMRLPIDYFFRSLAGALRERAIAVVLSGTGSDGALGVRAIKGEGGMVMVQDPESAAYDGMPRSAIATGMVDFVLPPEKLPEQLLAYVNHSFGRSTRPVEAPTPRAESLLKKICLLLRDQIGHDFSQYKESTLARRIERRMAVHQIERIDDYFRYLQTSRAEAEALFRDLLIGVTNFFRDPEAFAALEHLVIPRIFEGKAAGATIRVWVCGCSTGEEAYSIAILLQEHMESLRQSYRVQVFATDIDRRAIEQARSGVFPTSIAADISPERLARFFAVDPDSGIYRVQRAIRDLIIFSEQDVIKDPPFSKLDLISCRNLLIYMNMELQKRLIPLFHYALNPKGVLFLGTSETVGDYTTLFNSLERKWKIYQRIDDFSAADRPALGNFVLPITESSALPLPRHEAARGGVQPNYRILAEQALLEHYAQVGVLINGRGEVLFIYGRTGQYLEPAPGEAGMNILAMAREGLRQALAAALQRAVTQKAPVRYPRLQVRTNGDLIVANLIVQPVLSGVAATPVPDLFLVLLEEVAPAGADLLGQATAQGASAALDSLDARIATLEQELRAKDEYLQSTVEEMETANEELRSTNEELQSVNEELQSTNEELETSKEELQSVNEELATVNAELQTKVVDLSRANNDMNNLLAGTGVATLFVDRDLRISRFTPTATQLINLIQSDIGRPVGHIVSNLVGYDRLVQDTQAVLDTLIPQETEVQTVAGSWFLMRIRPYRTLQNVIEGVVITFMDITERKQAEQLGHHSESMYRALFEQMQEAFALLEVIADSTGHPVDYCFVEVNPAFERMFGDGQGDRVGRKVTEFADQSLYLDHLPSLTITGASTTFIATLTHPHRKLSVSAFIPEPVKVAVLFFDITARTQAEEDSAAS